MIEPPRVAPATLHWQDATIARVVENTPRIKSFFFRLPRPFRFHAGQHVDIRLTAEDGYRTERSYSIASGPEDIGELELAIEKVDDGEVSSFFHDVAMVGDLIELRGPIGGYFVWDVADGGPLFLIGGGSGTVPLMSMLRHRRAKKSTVPTLLLVSARTWSDVPFREELLQYATDDPTFKLVFAITREPVKRPGDYMRRIDGTIIRELLRQLPAAPKSVFVCGTNAFVNAAADGAVAAGVVSSLIHTERYGGVQLSAHFYSKGETEHAPLTERGDLPDSVFAFPKERKEPLTDASHVRNAIARFDQTIGVSDAERELAFANLRKAAEYYDVGMTETDWHQLGRAPHTGRTAEDRRASAREAVETKRERGELPEPARRAVETKPK